MEALNVIELFQSIDPEHAPELWLSIIITLILVVLVYIVSRQRNDAHVSKMILSLNDEWSKRVRSINEISMKQSIEFNLAVSKLNDEIQKAQEHQIDTLKKWNETSQKQERLIGELHARVSTNEAIVTRQEDEIKRLMVIVQSNEKIYKSIDVMNTSIKRIEDNLSKSLADEKLRNVISETIKPFIVLQPMPKTDDKPDDKPINKPTNKDETNGNDDQQ